jgi:hypothetical protein
MKRIPFLILTVLVLVSCSTKHWITIDEAFVKLNELNREGEIAILTLVTRGNMIPNYLGDYFSSRLSENLFAKLRFNVKDRSLVRFVEEKYKIEDAKKMDQELLTTIFNELKIKYLLVGEIEQFDDPSIMEIKSLRITINIRMIDDNGKVKGTANIIGRNKGFFQSFIDESINQIIVKMSSK